MPWVSIKAPHRFWPSRPLRPLRQLWITTSARSSPLVFCFSPFTSISPSMGTTLSTKSLFSLKASPKVPSPTFLTSMRPSADSRPADTSTRKSSKVLTAPPDPAAGCPHSLRSRSRSVTSSSATAAVSSVSPSSVRPPMTSSRASTSPPSSSPPSVASSAIVPRSSSSLATVSNLVLSLMLGPRESLPPPLPPTRTPLSLLTTIDDLLLDLDCLLWLYEQSPPILASRTASFALSVGSGDSSTSS
mmetsp:Transcript_6951/g.23922  ORF Transcript_6951/g.23922 Transcript_6951/m.23922 type:complete len:245 (-) Transcript_6951:64-798(-)